ncbi:ferredoxin Fer [Haloarchaeobius iranensis]|uniref:Ferredoxin n=1 Tax=Haloarchaeobius iranensis TaxID=996166 RepID=A0A1G9XL04_9EURY|nr:ferredoxin Fer [Haloarchaeobius iranensis]SDM97438.1 Ferredoxin [Haloarchaeobius iranensis]
MPSPFDVLQVDPDADEQTVHQAYRRRVKEAHPDQGGSAQEFQLVQSAYETIIEGGADSWYETNGTDEPATAAESAPEPEQDPNVYVEYLDYEAVVANGWELGDDELFRKARRAGLDEDAHGELTVEPGDYLLEAAEDEGFDWPFSCRGGACANCAVLVVDGEMEMTVDNVLSDDLVAQGIQLSCIGTPVSDDLKVVFNVKDLPGLEELQLPSRMN